ncbi:hypothetical protein ABV409_04235 [Flagellimonas sp. DF-77]|uniref:hypothetical protein n=1 Tax=Flagellimonas algarum TaxID=3230298 RepID=UPI00339801CE
MNEQSKNPGSDEVDLGQLFQLLGNAISKFFAFIGSIFTGLFRAVMIFLLFIQKNFILFVAAAVFGGVGGYFLDQYKPRKYISKMVIEPNFNSVQQLYNNIDFYNDLAKAEDSVALSNALGIATSDAGTIVEIFVDSYSDENQKIKLFDEFVRDLDTTTVKALDFESYLKNFNSLDARFHQISVVSTDNKVAKKIQPAIISSISANDYFKLQKSISDINLRLQDSIYVQQLVEIDSLQRLYQTVLVKEADNPMQGTSINLADNGESQNKELALIQEREVLKNRLVKLNEERANKSAILNVISDFPARGVKQKGFWKSYLFVLPIVLVGAVLFMLSMIQLNSFLKEYKRS